VKNGAYITIQDIDNTANIKKNSGVINKINAQYRVLQEHFNMRMEIYAAHEPSLLTKISRRMPFFPVVTSWRGQYEYQSIDFLYIRIEVIDRFFIEFLKGIKRQNPHVIIIGEIPTYPYDKEFTWLNLPLLVKNRIHRKRLKLYIDRIVTLSNDEEIFGIKTIRIVNGIDTAGIKVLASEKKDEKIRLIAVSTLNFWHGYDRLINGMAEYYSHGGRRDIQLDIVGSGDQYENCCRMINDNGLSNHIFMHGFKRGDELDALYRIADIGFCSLGAHRKEIYLSSELKSREYLARGLPIVSSIKIDVIPEGFKYCLYVPEDETPVDMGRVVDFYDKLFTASNKLEICAKIRRFTEERCDMKVTMHRVIEDLNTKS